MVKQNMMGKQIVRVIIITWLKHKMKPMLTQLRKRYNMAVASVVFLDFKYIIVFVDVINGCGFCTCFFSLDSTYIIMLVGLET